MADLNRKNRSITPGDFEFSGGVITAISGYPIGGTGGTIVGITYRGDGSTIDVNNDTKVITIHELCKQKIDSIPHKVGDLSDSANYYTKNECDERFVLSSDYNAKISEIDSGLAYLSANKQDELTFGYYNNSISAINGSAINVNGNFYSASNPSGFVNSAQVGTQIDEKLQNYYLKTDTSGKDELSDAFNNIMKYNVTAQQGCEVQSAVDNGVTTFGISITATPVVTDTRLSGYNGIAAEPDGNASGLWNVGLTQDMLNTINGKLDTTLAAQTYQPIGDYLSANALTNYYTKSETSGAAEISAALGNKVDKPSSLQNKYLVLRTNNDGSVSGWVDILDKVYSKTEADGTFQKKTDMGSYLTTAQYATDSATFVTSGDYISGSKQYALTSGGWEEISANTDYTAGTDLKIDENNVISVDTNGNANNTATNNRNFVEGSWTIADGYNCHAEGVATSAFGYGVHAQGMWTCFSSTDGQTSGGLAPIYWGIGAGAAVEGYCNATTACPMSGTVEGENYGPVHGGIIKVIGNGYVENEVHETDVHEHYPSDALILYRDGSLSAAGKISAAGVELGGGSNISIPVNIGTGNNVYYGNSTAYGVIGYNSTAGRVSFAFGGGTFADNNSFAVNDANSANNNSIAAGWKSSADQYSYAFGHGQPENSLPNVATNKSLSVGEHCKSNNCSQSFGQANTTDNYSLAAGHANTATYYSYIFGRGLSFTGNSDASTGYGALVAGGWNATNTNALFVLGNGTGNGNRKDAFVVDKNNNVFEGSVNTNNITGNTTHIEGGYNSISVYNTSVAGYNHIEGEANNVTGHSIHVEGAFNIFQSNSTADRGISIEGYANATSANDTSVHNGILKVIGNGERISQSDIRRSDAYILYKDGTVKAKDFIAGGNTLSANYPVPKTVPNTADNTLKIQRMFVCTSDNDIIAHINAGLAEGEGCVFFRVGS